MTILLTATHNGLFGLYLSTEHEIKFRDHTQLHTCKHVLYVKKVLHNHHSPLLCFMCASRIILHRRRSNALPLACRCTWAYVWVDLYKYLVMYSLCIHVSIHEPIHVLQKMTGHGNFSSVTGTFLCLPAWNTRYSRSYCTHCGDAIMATGCDPDLLNFISSPRDLSHNFFFGSLPEDLSNIASLQYLWVANVVIWHVCMAISSFCLPPTHKQTIMRCLDMQKGCDTSAPTCVLLIECIP